MRNNSDFFDYGKNLSNLLNSKGKIEIYISPNKRLRKRSEDDKFFQFHKDKEKFIFMNKFKSYDIRKTDSMTLLEGRRRFNNKTWKKNNDTELIISDIDPKDESSDNPTLYNGRRNKRIFNYKSAKNVISFNALKKNIDKTKKKKVSFANKFATIIDVESYKKYNVNEFLGDNADTKCTCLIY